METTMVTGLSDLRALEKQAFRKFYEDGLLDLLFGLMMVCLSLGSIVQDRLGGEWASMAFMFGIALVLVASFMMVRVRLLRSRLGDFKPGPSRRRRIALTRLVLLGSAVLGVAVFAFSAVAGGKGMSATAVETLLPLVWFVNAVVVLGVTAYLLDVPRFYLYGVLFGLVGPLLIWPDVLWDFRLPPPLAFGIPALPILAIGTWKLIRFLQTHPVQVAPTPGAGLDL
jgi:hypothetical protein